MKEQMYFGLFLIAAACSWAAGSLAMFALVFGGGLLIGGMVMYLDKKVDLD